MGRRRRWEVCLETKIRQSFRSLSTLQSTKRSLADSFFVIEWHVMSRKRQQGVKIASYTVPRQRGRACQHRGPQCHSCWRDERTTRLKKKKRARASAAVAQCCQKMAAVWANGACTCTLLPGGARARLTLHAQRYQTQGVMKRWGLIRRYQLSGGAGQGFDAL